MSIDLRNEGEFAAAPNTAAPTLIGMQALTLGGCVATARLPALTPRDYNRWPRVAYRASASTAGTVMTIRHANAVLHPLPISGSGGFGFSCRFGIGDDAVYASTRMFVGLRTGGAALTGVDPATLTNCIGIGHNSGDTTMKLYYGGTAAQTPIDLGASFPANDAQTSAYDLTIISDLADGSLTWLVRQYRGQGVQISGPAATGIIPYTATVPLNDLRVPNAALGFSAMRQIVAGTGFVAIDLFRMKQTIA